MFENPGPGRADVSGKCKHEAAPGAVDRPGGQVTGLLPVTQFRPPALSRRRPLLVPSIRSCLRSGVPRVGSAVPAWRRRAVVATFGRLATPEVVTAASGRHSEWVRLRGYAMAARLEHKWCTVSEVAAMLQFGLSKTKQLVACGEIRSVRVGGNRRILPEWVDEFVAESIVRGER